MEAITRTSSMHRLVTATVAVLLGVVVGQVTCQAPIPPRPPGFVYCAASGDCPVVLEAFVDLICPDSKAAWPVYKEVANYYGNVTLKFSALLFPLPYHRAAMMAAQGTFIADALNSATTFAWMDEVFSKQEALYDTTIFNQTQGYIVDTLSKWAAAVGYSQTTFKEHLARSDPTQTLARTEFKYGGTRGVYGTPETFVNGIQVLSDPSWTLADWRKIIDPLLAAKQYYRKQP
ncbi:uncharacterized protein [Diadema antillarum]|uniref:uncharacterized protein n=1 Tax=Diadema antillarum TaxID=105358 RepID=UPI003A8C06B3